MKFFKNLLSIVALCIISSIDAKISTRKKTKPTVQPVPSPTKITQQPPIQQPIVQEPLSYKELVAYVKNAHNAWDNATSKLRADFVTTIVQKARALRLDDFQLESLLQTARDMHGIFSGNAQRDIATLQSLDNQIAAAIRQ